MKQMKLFWRMKLFWMICALGVAVFGLSACTMSEPTPSQSPLIQLLDEYYWGCVAKFRWNPNTEDSCSGWTGARSQQQVLADICERVPTFHDCDRIGLL